MKLVAYHDHFNKEGIFLAELVHYTLGDLLDEQVKLYGKKEAVVYPEKGSAGHMRTFKERCMRLPKV